MERTLGWSTTRWCCFGFFPLGEFFTDKRFLKLEFESISGKYIPYFQRLVPHIIGKGYTLTSLFVNLHKIKTPYYEDIEEYRGAMHTTSDKRIVFYSTIPFTRQWRFIDPETAQLR